MTQPVIVQLGNQRAPFATEAAYRDGYTAAGCTVIGIDQEEAYERGPQFVLDQCDVAHADMLVYSRTHNNTALGPEWTETWRTLEGRETKTCGVHLDVFWGLSEREDWILRDHDPQFTVGTLFTADGGSDDKWKAAGVSHRWLAPGADTRFIPDHAEPFAELAGKVVFVGSSMGYHDLWPHRMEMVDFARKTWGERFVEIGNGTAWGPRRGEDLARIYASDCVVIGDFCFAGERAMYWSDRIPETLARGGVLAVTNTPGLWSRYAPGIDLFTWTVGDFDGLRYMVDFLGNESVREVLPQMKKGIREKIASGDTYRHRAREVLDIMEIGQ